MRRSLSRLRNYARVLVRLTLKHGEGSPWALTLDEVLVELRERQQCVVDERPGHYYLGACPICLGTKIKHTNRREHYMVCEGCRVCCHQGAVLSGPHISLGDDEAERVVEANTAVIANCLEVEATQPTAEAIGMMNDCHPDADGSGA